MIYLGSFKPRWFPFFSKRDPPGNGRDAPHLSRLAAEVWRDCSRPSISSQDGEGVFAQQPAGSLQISQLQRIDDRLVNFG